MERDPSRRLSIINKYIPLLTRLTLCSHDPYTKVGCILFDGDGNELSEGCNREPTRWREIYPWNDRELKNKYVIHAEIDALSQLPVGKKYRIPEMALISLFPCINCAKALIQSGVEEIYYRDIRFNEDASEVMTLCHMCDVKLIKV